MRKNALAAVLTGGLLLFATGCTAEDKATSGTPQLDTMEQKVSYSLGLNIGQDMKQQDIKIEPDLVSRGIRDAMTGAEPLMSQEEIQSTFMEFQKELMAKQQKASEEMATTNLQEGEAFLEENLKKEGVKSLPSGLQYKVIEEGKGASPKAEDTVKVHYEGRLIDGTVFDSSVKRGEPATCPVNGVIPGWTEALQNMKEGAKWEIYVPPSLAYGERGAGQLIEPNSTLIFEVELLEVNPEQ